MTYICSKEMEIGEIITVNFSKYVIESKKMKIIKTQQMYEYQLKEIPNE